MGQDAEIKNVPGACGLQHYSCHLDLLLLMRSLTGRMSVFSDLFASVS